MPPSLLFFLDPLRGYEELEAYRYFFVSYHSQIKLLAEPHVGRQLHKHHLDTEITQDWDRNISFHKTDSSLA